MQILLTQGSQAEGWDVAVWNLSTPGQFDLRWVCYVRNIVYTSGGKKTVDSSHIYV